MAVDLLGGPEVRLSLLDSLAVSGLFSSLYHSQKTTVHLTRLFVWKQIPLRPHYQHLKKERSHFPLPSSFLYVLYEFSLLNTNSLK